MEYEIILVDENMQLDADYYWGKESAVALFNCPIISLPIDKSNDDNLKIKIIFFEKKTSYY